MNATSIPPEPIPTETTHAESIPAIWIRPPRGKEPCPHTGLRHGTFYRLLVGNSKIRQCVACEGVTRKGTRLLWFPDAHGYLMGLANEQAGRKATNR